MSGLWKIAWLACLLSVSACTATATGQPETPSSPPALVTATPPSTPEPTPNAPLLIPRRVVRTGDVAGWPGGWSPDGRFYVFHRWRADAPCSGESIHAYDTLLDRDVPLSSDDYCTTDIDPNLIWDGDSTLILGDGPGGQRWEAITLGDDVMRVTLDDAPPACVDRQFPLPPALQGIEATRARWSPDQRWLALALVPGDDSLRYAEIPGNQPDLRVFQRLVLTIFPADGDSRDALQVLGPIFDLAPDELRDEEIECSGTQIRWSDDGQMIISSMGPFIYGVPDGETFLAPDGPNAGPLGPNLRWSPDDAWVADDTLLLNVHSGDLHTPPGMLPGYDRGFGPGNQLIHVNQNGLAAYDPISGERRQLTNVPQAIFVAAPDGSRITYIEDGDLWMLDLTASSG